MTDKQIIIDGCDVSGCDRLNIFPMQFGEPHEICLTSLEQWGGQEKYCKDRPNCYYKQLKRKEQECEELKEEINSLVCSENCYKYKQAEQLKADFEQYKSSKQASYEEMQKRWNEVELENRKLKASLDEKNDLLQKLGISATGEFKRIKYFVDKLVAENEELKNFHINLVGVKECEIKELLKLKQTLTEIKEIAEVDCSCGHNQMCICNVCDKFDEILQKISEVEDE